MASRKKRYTTSDFWFTEDGDFAVSEAGDLLDTSSDGTRALLQEVRTVVEATSGDWPLYPEMGANLDSLIGSPSTEAVAEDARSQIIEALVDARILAIDQFNIIPLVLGTNFILRIIISGPQEDLAIQFGYDSDLKRFRGM